MKKALVFILTAVLAIALAACGGAAGSADVSAPGSSSVDSATGSSVPETVSQTMSFDMSKVFGSEGVTYAQLSPADKQALKDAAEADGQSVDFGADGSVTFTDKVTGDVVKQNADGSWSYSDAQGNSADVQFGGDWPSNKFTAMIPKPAGTIMTAVTDGEIFSATVAGMTDAQYNEFVSGLKAKGFTQNVTETDSEYAGIKVRVYMADNGSYTVSVSSGLESAVSITVTPNEAY